MNPQTIASLHSSLLFLIHTLLRPHLASNTPNTHTTLMHHTVPHSHFQYSTTHSFVHTSITSHSFPFTVSKLYSHNINMLLTSPLYWSFPPVSQYSLYTHHRLFYPSLLHISPTGPSTPIILLPHPHYYTPYPTPTHRLPHSSSPAIVRTLSFPTTLPSFPLLPDDIAVCGLDGHFRPLFVWLVATAWFPGHPVPPFLQCVVYVWSVPLWFCSEDNLSSLRLPGSMAFLCFSVYLSVYPYIYLCICPSLPIRRWDNVCVFV